MAEEPKTYQPKWEEHKGHKHHHHHAQGPSEKNRGWGGALRMRDKQAYYGLICVLLVVAVLGLYKLVGMVVKEIKAMPKDDPATEMVVDELRIHKADEQDAISAGDSLAQEYNLDSMKRRVHIETRPVYRPPRRENKWYITQREWKKIWKEYKIMRWERKQQQQNEEKEKNKETDK